jgi:hypothetical protein
MPQFDKITFFNQIFWLFVFFSGYYLLLLKVFLPKLGAVLKARSKKLQKGTEGVIGFKQEQEQVSVGFNNSIEKMSSVVRKTISDSTVLTDKWVVLSIKDIKQGLEPTYHSKDFLRGIQSIENNLWKQLIISHLTKKN